MTLEGREATIFIGKQVPQVVAMRQYLIEHQYVEYAVQFANVGTQLKVLPRIRGPYIEVEITPELSYQSPLDQKLQRIRVDRLSSTVSVPNGQTIQLGSVATASEFFDEFYRTERGERLEVSLTPRVME